MNILITGGAGFIGSNFLKYMVNKYPNYNFFNIDLLTYAGTLSNLKEIELYANYFFIKGNICDREFIETLFDKYQFEGVIHFAAESHVDNSIKNPTKFVETNINGTFILLDVAKRNWLYAPFNPKEKFKYARFHHISTDEVYGSLEKEGHFTEESPYLPNSPYSASKAASDFLVRSYFHTYGMNVVTTNCSNNFGPNQHEEKLIPTIVSKAVNLEKIPVYGDGSNVRDWLYVYDHCTAIDKVFHNGISGETYLIGGSNEYSNNEIVTKVCEILDNTCSDILKKSKLKSFKELIEYTEDRAGHDFRYAINANKIKKQLGWKSMYSFDKALEHTVLDILDKKIGNTVLNRFI